MSQPVAVATTVVSGAAAWLRVSCYLHPVRYGSQQPRLARIPTSLDLNMAILHKLHPTFILLGFCPSLATFHPFSPPQHSFVTSLGYPTLPLPSQLIVEVTNVVTDHCVIRSRSRCGLDMTSLPPVYQFILCGSVRDGGVCITLLQAATHLCHTTLPTPQLSGPHHIIYE